MTTIISVRIVEAVNFHYDNGNISNVDEGGENHFMESRPKPCLSVKWFSQPSITKIAITMF